MTNPKNITLTFDDGPNPPYTNQILDILKRKKTKAIFFVCGANVKRYPQIIKRASKEGHLIGNHTYNHRRLPTLLGLNYAEIVKTQTLIKKLTNQKQKLFRPPFGVMPFWMKRKLEKDGFKIVYYDVDSEDWQKNISVKQIVQNVTLATHDGSIILLHDGHNVKKDANRSKTVEALPKIIKTLQIYN